MDKVDLSGAAWRKSSRSSGNGACVEIAYVGQRAVWRKSSRSSGNGECVEIAYVGEVAAARDSKNPGGPALVFAAEALRELVRHL